MIPIHELLRLLESRRILRPEQRAEFAQEMEAAGILDADSGARRLVERGWIAGDLLDGLLAVFENPAWRFGEPKDLELRLLRLGLATPKDLARVRGVRDHVRGISPDDVPSIAQTLFRLGILRREALEEAMAADAAGRTIVPDPEEALPIRPNVLRPATRRLYKARPLPPRRPVVARQGDKEVPVAPVFIPSMGGSAPSVPSSPVVNAVPVPNRNSTSSGSGEPDEDPSAPAEAPATSRDFRLMFDFEMKPDPTGPVEGPA